MDESFRMKPMDYFKEYFVNMRNIKHIKMRLAELSPRTFNEVDAKIILEQKLNKLRTNCRAFNYAVLYDFSQRELSLMYQFWIKKLPLKEIAKNDGLHYETMRRKKSALYLKYRNAFNNFTNHCSNSFCQTSDENTITT